MPKRRPIALFLAKVCGIYLAILFLGPYVGTDDVYSASFRAAGRALFRTMGGEGRVMLEPTSAESAKYDTTVTMLNTSNGARGTMEVMTRKTMYLPTVFTMSLILATPLPWRRRVIGAVAGLGMISVFVAIQFYLQLVDALSGNDPLNVYQLSPFMKGAVGILIKTLALTPVTSYMIPALIWAGIALQQKNREVLRAMCWGHNDQAGGRALS